MTVFWVVCLVIIIVAGVGVLAGGAPFVPTRRKWIDEALELAEVDIDDVLVDLGSGTGEVLRAAITRGAKRAIGYEINPLLVWWSRLRARRFGARILIRNHDFFSVDLPIDTTIIYIFQVDKVLRKVPEFLKQQKPHLRAEKLKVVVFGFKIPGKKPVKTLNGMSLYEF